MNYLRRICGVVLAGYWALLFAATHIPGGRLPDTHVSDKLEHFLSYGLLGGLLYLTLWTARPSRRNIGLLVLAVGAAYGAFDELTQALPFVHRSCDVRDWLADVSGLSVAAVGMTLAKWVTDRGPAPAPPGADEIHS